MCSFSMLPTQQQESSLPYNFFLQYLSLNISLDQHLIIWLLQCVLWDISSGPRITSQVAALHYLVVTVSMYSQGHILWPALLSNDSSGGLVGTASVADTLSTHSAAPLLNQTGVTVCHSCSVECCTGREGLWWPDEGRRPSSVTIRQFPFHPDSTTPSSVKHDLLAFIHSWGG